MRRQILEVKIFVLLLACQAALFAGATGLDGNSRSYQADAGAYDNAAAQSLPGANADGQVNVDDDIDLTSGTVRLTIPLESLTGLGRLKGGIDGGLVLNYNNQYKYERYASNKDVQTSIVGLGWKMDYSPIGITAVIVDHKRTASAEDDNYYLASGGQVPLISWFESGTKKFRIGYEPNTKVEAYYKDGIIIGFQVKMIDGTIADFGDYRGASATGEDPNNATWYTLRCGKWVGYGGSQSAPTQTWSRYPYRFELSRLRDAYGNTVNLKYDKRNASTFNHVALPGYTQDLWLDEITYSGSQYRVKFHYGDREAFEYGDQDQLFEIFSRKYLSGVEFLAGNTGAQTMVRKYELEYEMCNTDMSRYSSDMMKRQLKTIMEVVPKKSNPAQTSSRILWGFEYYREQSGWENYLKAYHKIGGMKKEFVYQQNAAGNVHTDLHEVIESTGEDVLFEHHVVNDNYLALGDYDGTYIWIYNFDGKWLKRMEIDINGSGNGENVLVDRSAGEPYCYLVGLFGTPQYLVAVLAERDYDSESGESSFRTRYIQAFHYDGAKWQKGNRADIWCNNDASNPNNTNGFWKSNNDWLKVDTVNYAIGTDFYVVSTHTMRNVFASYWDANTKQWQHNQNAAVAPTIAGHSELSTIDNNEIRWTNLQCGNDFFMAEYYNMRSITREEDETCTDKGGDITDWFVTERSEAMLLAPHWNRKSKLWEHTNAKIFFWEDIDKWYGHYWYSSGGGEGPTYLKHQSGIVDNNHIIASISYCNSSDGENKKGRSRIYDIRWNESTRQWEGNATTSFGNDNSWGSTPEDNAVIVDNSHTRIFPVGVPPCRRDATNLRIIRDVVCSPTYFTYKYITHADESHIYGVCEDGSDWNNMNYVYGNVFTGEGWKTIHVGDVGTTTAPCGNICCMNLHYLRDFFAFPDFFVFDVKKVKGDEGCNQQDISRSYITNFYPKTLGFSPLKMLFDATNNTSDELWYVPFSRGQFVFGNDFLGVSERRYKGKCDPPSGDPVTNGLHFPIYDRDTKTWYSNKYVGETVPTGEPKYYDAAAVNTVQYKFAAGRNFFVFNYGKPNTAHGVKLVRRYARAVPGSGYEQPHVEIIDLSSYYNAPDTIQANGDAFILGNTGYNYVFKFDSLTNSVDGSVPDYPVSSVRIHDGKGNQREYQYTFKNGLHTTGLNTVNYGTAEITDPLNNVVVKKFITPETDLTSLNAATGYTYSADDLPYLIGNNYKTYTTKTGETTVYSSSALLCERVALNGAYPVSGADALKEKHIKLTAEKKTVDGVTKRWQYAYDGTHGEQTKSLFKNGAESLLEYTQYAREVTQYQNTNVAVLPYFEAAYQVNEASYQITDPPPVAGIREAFANTYKDLGGGVWTLHEHWGWKVPMNSSGAPSVAFSPFDLSDRDANNWKLMTNFSVYDPYANVVQATNPLQVSDVTIYGSLYQKVIGFAKNSTFYETGLFTGDYQKEGHGAYWDYENGWEKGGTNTVELTSDASHVHFGAKSIHVIQDYAAGRNNRICPGKAYRMSAWVKVTSGTIKMATDFRYANAGHENDWPATQVTAVATPGAIWATPVNAADCNGQWKMISMEIPASTTSQLDASKVWYARAWVGNDPTAPSFEAYVDGIRFYPTDALVATQYYDATGQNLTCRVDANDKALFLDYEDFNRVANEYNNAKQKRKSYEYNTVKAVVPTVVYVNDDAAAGGDGTSWTTAYNNLKTAIDNTAANKEIWVAGGTYTTGGANLSFQLKNGQKLYGGFAGTEKHLHERVLSRQTKLWAQGSGYTTKILVLAATGCVVDGFDFNKANVNAMKCEGVNNVTIANCYFDDNDGVNGIDGNNAWAPALKIKNCNGVSIRDVQFINNSSQQDGGAIGITGSEGVNVTGCTISLNSATRNSGAVDIWNSSCVFQNCRFAQNTAIVGGALSTYQSTVRLDMCEFEYNYGSDFYGAIWNDEKSDMAISACQFASNHATAKDGGAIGNQGSDMVIVSSSFTGCVSGRNGGAFFSSPNSDQGSRGLKSNLTVSDTYFGNNSAANTGGAGVAQIGSFCESNNGYSGNTAPNTPNVYVANAPCNP